MNEKTILICPLCRKKTNVNLEKISEYAYCTYCKLGWFKKNKVIKYDTTYYQGKSRIVSNLFIPIEKMFYFIRNSYLPKKIYDVWIDVGAGNGNYLINVKSRKKIGVEISKAGRKIMKKNKLTTMTNNDFLQKKNFRADIISFWHVLEHVDKPWQYLEASRKNLKNSGKIIIGVPNCDSFEFYMFGKYWFHLVPNFHLFQFSTKSILLLLKKSGFKVEKIDYFAIEHHLTGVLQSFINFTAKSDSVLHRLIKRRQSFSNLYIKDIFWIFFWCSLGLPFILIFWIIGAVFKKSGTLVIVASKLNS